MGSSSSSINTFQCQQMCSTINVLIQSKSMCCKINDGPCLKGISTMKSFCSGSCDKKTTCALPQIKGCGDYDTSSCSGTPTLTCNTAGSPVISGC
jgi:hypothetical protein